MLRTPSFYFLFVWMSVTPCLAQADTPPSNSAPTEAAAVFGRLRDYLKTNPLDFKTSFVAQGLTPLKGEFQFLVQRPKSFRIDSKIGRDSYLVVSDGQVMTIYVPKNNKYAQVPAPALPTEGLNIVSGLMATESQVLRFIGVVDAVAEGQKEVHIGAAGSETIGGKECEHFTIVEATEAVTNTWKVWLQKGQIPLPCKFEAQSSDFMGSQTNEFSWKQPSPPFPSDTFVFTPPKGSKKVSVGDLGLEPFP